MSSRLVIGAASSPDPRPSKSGLSRLVSLSSWAPIPPTPSLPRASSAASSASVAPAYGDDDGGDPLAPDDERDRADEGLVGAAAAERGVDDGMGVSSGSGGASASAARTAVDVLTAVSRRTVFGSRSGSIPLYAVWRTCPSRVQPPISARITSSGRIQVMLARSPPHRPR